MSPAIIEVRRATLEAKIEELISLLDFLDGDPDIEDDDPAEENGDLEPSLAAPGQFISGVLQYDLEEDNSDLEPSCGWTINGVHGYGDEEEEPNGDELDTNFSEDGN